MREDKDDRKPKLYEIFHGEVANVQAYGAFIKIPNCKRQGLVHKTQMSTARIEDPNEMLAKGERVYCKVIAIEEEGEKIALSMKVINQTTGADQDPNNVQLSQDEKKRRQWKHIGKNKIELGAELNTTCGRCGGHGHLTIDCYSVKGDNSYDLIPDMAELMEKAAADHREEEDETGRNRKTSHKKKKKTKSKKDKKEKKKKTKKRKRDSFSDSDGSDNEDYNDRHHRNKKDTERSKKDQKEKTSDSKRKQKHSRKDRRMTKSHSEDSESDNGRNRDSKSMRKKRNRDGDSSDENENCKKTSSDKSKHRNETDRVMRYKHDSESGMSDSHIEREERRLSVSHRNPRDRRSERKESSSARKFSMERDSGRRSDLNGKDRKEGYRSRSVDREKERHRDDQSGQSLRGRYDVENEGSRRDSRRHDDSSNHDNHRVEDRRGGDDRGRDRRRESPSESSYFRFGEGKYERSRDARQRSEFSPEEKRRDNTSRRGDEKPSSLCDVKESRRRDRGERRLSREEEDRRDRSDDRRDRSDDRRDRSDDRNRYSSNRVPERPERHESRSRSRDRVRESQSRNRISSSGERSRDRGDNSRSRLDEDSDGDSGRQGKRGTTEGVKRNHGSKKGRDDEGKSRESERKRKRRRSSSSSSSSDTSSSSDDSSD